MLTDQDAGSAVLVMNRGDKDVKLLQSVLHKVGFRVANCEDGNEALKSLAAGDAPLRLVVVDPATPNFELQPFLEKLRQAGPDIRVLCLSEDGAETAALAPACAERIGGRLMRPFRRSHLLASILEATEKPLVRTA